MIGVSALLLAACGPQDEHGHEHDQVQPEAPRAFAEAVLGMVAESGQWTPADAMWPDDLGEHPDAPLESREWFVLLADSEGDVVHGLQQRMTRVALSGESSHPSGQGSAWHFDSVMQAAGRWDRHGGSSDSWQKTERIAAGLSQAFQADKSRDLTAPTELQAHVLGHLAGFTASASMRGAGTPDVCAGSWVLSVPGYARLSLAQQNCPQDARRASVAITRSAPLLVSGERYENDKSIAVHGVAWMRHSWGSVESNKAAVLLDTLVLTLRDIGTFEVIATRRRSGQGAAVVTASLGSTEFDDVSWSSISPCRIAYACKSRLHIPALDLDVTVQALAGTDTRSDLDGRLRRVVVVNGTHQGGGYTDIEGDTL